MSGGEKTPETVDDGRSLTRFRPADYASDVGDDDSREATTGGPEFPPVLTTAMAAELLHVHVEYLRSMVRDGRIPCHRFPGGREIRFLRDELLEWLAHQEGVNRAPSARRD